MRSLNLDSFNNRCMDGLLFCRMAYVFFNQIHDGPDGVKRLRTRPTDTEKKLLEELLPIARFIQIRTRPGLNLQVRWVYGNQSYDAVLRQSGWCVNGGAEPGERILEVTGVYHPNHYLVKEALSAGIPVFGLDGLSRDPITGEVISIPTVRTNYDFVERFAERVVCGIAKKATKAYSPGAILLAEINLDTPYDDHEWDHLIKFVRQRLCEHTFSEIWCPSGW